MRTFARCGLALTAVLTLAGCATITGPSVSREEINAATEDLKVKGLAHQLKQIKRINDIGYRLIAAVPREDVKEKPAPFLGLISIPINRYVQKLYGIGYEQRAAIAVVVAGSPAEKAGLKPGDVLLAVNGRDARNARSLSGFVRESKTGDTVNITVARKTAGAAGEERLTIPVTVGSMPVRVEITMVDEQSVNAAASTGSIYVTYGLMNFARTDDEIAAVLAHELAHIVRGHLPRAQGSQLLGVLAAVLLGSFAESSSPGSGQAVMRTVGAVGDVFSAGFSRDLEKEADYFSVKYTYLGGYDPEACLAIEERFAVEIPASLVGDYFSTHPTSAERTVRIRKAIDEIKQTKGKGRPPSE